MNNRMDEPLHRERAQGMAEFALILPLLLVVVLGIIEMGRLLFIYSAVMTSSREAVRYGSSVGTNSSLPNFRDCAGIRSSALRMASLAGVDQNGIVIRYDHGPGVASTVSLPSSCDTALDSTLFTLGDRVVVTVTAVYTPLIQLLNIPSFPISSHSARTIVREVPLSPPPPLVTQTHLVEFVYPNASQITEPDSGSINVPVGVYYNGDPLPIPVTVPLFAYGDAVTPDDFTIPTSVVIPANSSSATFNVQVMGDLIDEFDEKVNIRMLQPRPVTAVALGVLITHTLTILDNDPLPAVGFAVSASSGLEGTGTVNSSAVQVSLYQPGTSNPIVSGKPVTVTFTVSGGTAIASDYSLIGTSQSGAVYTLGIPPGQSSGLIYINPTPDSMFEANETVNLSLSSPVNAVLRTGFTTHTFTITNDDDPPVVSFVWPAQQVREGTAGTAMLMLDRISGVDTTININFTLGAGVIYNRDRCQANKNYDFVTDNPDMPGGSVIIPAGSLYSSPSTLFTACNDNTVAEPNETVTAVISGVTNGTVGAIANHVFTITETNPTPPTLSFTSASQMVSEAAGVVPVIARLSGPSGQAISFSYSITGTAVYGGTGSDFTLSPVPGVVTIPAGGAEAVINAGIINDPYDEETETVRFSLANPVNATLGAITQHTLTITNDDVPTVDFALANQTVPEDTDVVEVVVRLNSPARLAVTVPFTVTGTATPGWENDYVVLTDTIVIPAGALAFTVPIYINNDGLIEELESIILTLGQPENIILGPTQVHTILIQDNDSGCSVSNGPLNYLLFGEGEGALLRRLSWSLTNQNDFPISLYSVYVNWPLERTGPFLDEVYVNYQDATSTPIWTMNIETSPAYLYGPWFASPENYLFDPGASKNIDVVFTNVMNSGPYLTTAVFLNQTTFQTCSISIFNVYTP